MALLWLLSCLAFASTALGCGEQDIYPVLSGFARVANGEEAVPGSWPWQVSVQEKDGWHVCGGSLISSRWVITSITCSVSTAHLVVLGEHDRGNNTEAVKTLSIEQVFTHPDWSPETKEFDVALIKLAKPVGFTKTVLPICIPPEGEEYTGLELCVTTGWGLTRNSAFFSPNKLQQAVVPLLLNLDCEAFFGSTISDTMVCAGGAGASACTGDIGGPLACERYGVWYLIGVASWGSNTCTSTSPAVYSRVTTFRTWIDGIVMAN
ncbi:chymotrypsinogen 2-like [Ambystoma mexicanum]|uniref:chymotrypsinogen 2-like n=1 Tax=Ambystoma mexicanum TaxID=8296 RepID=UPI0037E9971E